VHAVSIAGKQTAGDGVLLVSPMFPVLLEDRERVAPALRALVR
jgi:hypothetical protein